MSEYKIIHSASECLLGVFMDCLFKGEYKLLVIEGEPPAGAIVSAWRGIYMEYVDLSGAGKGEEVGLTKSIQLLENRVRNVKMFIALNKESLLALGVPYFPVFNNLRRYGHRVMWDRNSPDVASFLQNMKVIEAKETRYQAELDAKYKELMALHKKRIDSAAGKPAQSNSDRKEFVKLINSLRKFGFEISKNTTTVEEFAAMVYDFSEHCEEELSRNKSKN